MNDSKPYDTIQTLKQRANGEAFTVIAAVRKIVKKTSKTGNPFLQVEVGDASDTFVFNCFEGNTSYMFFQTPAEKTPQIVKIYGFVDFYAEKLSPNVKTIQNVDKVDYDTYLGKVIEKPDEPVDDLKKDLDALVKQITYPALQATVLQVFKDLGSGFYESVAAISMHHAYVHGLLEHTVHVGKVVQKLLPLYADVNADIALAGALLHDVGKVLEYSYHFGEGIDRTCVGRLQGHVVLGYRLVRRAGLQQKLHPTWQERLEHIVLSHQGEPEWGAAVYPSTPEAVLVGLADNLDAKMAMVHHQLKKAVNTQPFSDFVAGLDTKILTQPLPDPEELSL